jgi:hypothetical protein
MFSAVPFALPHGITVAITAPRQPEESAAVEASISLRTALVAMNPRKISIE